jgi:hypothetical protein
MADPTDHFVPLTRSGNPVQQSILRDALTEAGIPFLSTGELGPMALFGAVNPIDYVEFRVPPERLQEAKDLLCSQGIVCDVSERLLRRSLEEVVIPLLNRKDRDLERLLYLARINNKETVAALYESTRVLVGGAELLEDLFFAMARSGEGNLLILARALVGSTTESFGPRFLQEATSEGKETRMALLDVAAAFGAQAWILRSVAAGLLDPDPEVRDQAGEALFAVEGKDYGYDPEGPEPERQAAVARLLEATHLE